MAQPMNPALQAMVNQEANAAVQETLVRYPTFLPPTRPPNFPTFPPNTDTAATMAPPSTEITMSDDNALTKTSPDQQGAGQTHTSSTQAQTQTHPVPAPNTTATTAQTQTVTPAPTPVALTAAARRLKAQQEPTYRQIIQEHRVTTERLQDLAMEVEKYTKRIEAQAKGMKTQDARITYLIARIVSDKDRSMLRTMEVELKRTVHSLWKLNREVYLASKADHPHDMYELLEGFVNAIDKSRGPNREKWGEEGKELGEILDTIKADMEWWDDGNDE